MKAKVDSEKTELWASQVNSIVWPCLARACLWDLRCAWPILLIFLWFFFLLYIKNILWSFRHLSIGSTNYLLFTHCVLGTMLVPEATKIRQCPCQCEWVTKTMTTWRYTNRNRFEVPRGLLGRSSWSHWECQGTPTEGTATWGTHTRHHELEQEEAGVWGVRLAEGALGGLPRAPCPACEVLGRCLEKDPLRVGGKIWNRGVFQ